MVVTTVPTTLPMTMGVGLEPIDLHGAGVEAGGFLAARRVHFRPPAKLGQYGIGAPVYGIRDPLAQQGREFEAMAAVASGQHQSLSLRIRRNPEMPIPGVAI